MACCLTAPRCYLNQCRLLICEVLWHSPESNCTGSAKVTTLYNKIRKIKLPLPQGPKQGSWRTFFFLSRAWGPQHVNFQGPQTIFGVFLHGNRSHIFTNFEGSIGPSGKISQGLRWIFRGPGPFKAMDPPRALQWVNSSPPELSQHWFR